jgi:hypothetical protein
MDQRASAGGGGGIVTNLLQHAALLAQMVPIDDAPAPAAPQKKPMSFSDLQSGFRQWNDGNKDHSFHSGSLTILCIMGSVVALLLLIKLFERWRNRPQSDSIRALGRELLTTIPLPWTTRLLLLWIACSTRTPCALLLISPPHFNSAIHRWRSHGSFQPIRRWGVAKLIELSRTLYGIEAA